MKIFTADQIRQLDQYTINNEPISSRNLMERAASTFTDWFAQRFSDLSHPVHIFCGIGNNGGDGLVAARLLTYLGYELTVYPCWISDKTSPDFDTNFNRLPKRDTVEVIGIREGDGLPVLPEGGIIVDAIFGSGLNRPVEGYWAELLRHLNAQPCLRVAIDIPSGMFADKPTDGISFEAGYTFSFEFPKLGFLFPENDRRVGQWAVRSIGLHPEAIQQTETAYELVDEATAKALLRPRGKYSHKGTYGHALLFMGGYGKMGAAILAGKAALRAGLGLLSMHVPQRGYEILQISLPEAMASVDQHKYHLTEIPDLAPYNAIGMGCGLGQNENTQTAVRGLLQQAPVPLVIDADALNILGQHKEWQAAIPPNSILTPHPKEFERLFGPSANAFERNARQRDKAMELGVYIVLKGAHTCTATPEGKCYFNNSGNPGMATGGSGDVLAGLLTSLLAQGYEPEAAAVLGVYLHGLAGDLAAQDNSEEAMIASDLIEHFGAAYRQLHQSGARN
jgi:ADP-dependent NAD(P)H-hydrate dehydratase / NAD(P)H-hydrate epimerase